ncbi:MAG: aldehyde ferredoxin oxidoreductase family protein [Chloroflexi bacterium]|nr:aldehyde ferredoxin oxidoreductase family protein [Chloroflexota bacterium]
MVAGFTGRILRVDLSDGRTWVDEMPDSFYRRYLGGNGFIAYYLLHEMASGVDALGPDNLLVFATGTFTGLPITGAGRSSVGCKSPLTGGYGSADVGGFFGAELKQAGYDAVVVQGISPKPVYLWINDGNVEIRDASHIWGENTLETQEAIQAELGGDSRIRLAMIGPGGENLVKYACVINDLRHSAGRSGTGAVMGSKKLKAIAARGKGRLPVADQDKFRELSRFMTDHWKEMSWAQHDVGTPGGLVGLSQIGALPTRNFQDGQFEQAEKITGTTLRDTIMTGREGCYACPVRCKRVVEVHELGMDIDPQYGGPEYETIGAFGSNCGIDDLKAISKAHELCNAYGLDTISCGMAVSFAMECYENNLLTLESTGGLDLSFGNAASMLKLVEMICRREGLGALLAEGTDAAAASIGGNAMEFSITVKGQPFPMHECRTRHGQALGYALSPTGADHMHNFWDESIANEPLGQGVQELGIYTSVPRTDLSPDKVRAYMYVSNWQWVFNHLGNCMFINWTRQQMADIVSAITGWQTNVWELMRAGERGVTMARAFNMREGLTRDDDRLPLRMQQYHVTSTLNEEPVDPEVLEEAKETFYEMMGWDRETGKPTRGKLQELDIAWVYDQLAALD